MATILFIKCKVCTKSIVATEGEYNKNTLMWFHNYHLLVNIIAPEYPGYGIAPGYASENTVSQTIQSIYEFIVSPYGLNFPTNRLIIYGFSIGSGAAISVSQADLPDLNKIYFRKKFIKSHFARKYDNSRDSKDSKNKHNHHNHNHNHNYNNQNHKENGEKGNNRDTKTLYNTSNTENMNRSVNTNVNTMPLLSAANVHRKMNDQSFSHIHILVPCLTCLHLLLMKKLSYQQV